MGCESSFGSDNAAPVHPAVQRAMVAAIADADAPTYDGDGWSAGLEPAFAALFDRDVAVLWVTSGTAANGIALATLCPSHGAIICHDAAHLRRDEAGAPGFFTGGASLLPMAGAGAKLEANAVRAMLLGQPSDQHNSPPRCISVSNASEFGLAYTPAETAALGAVAREFGMRFHVDGARFANAVAFRKCAPADLTWRCGVDALSFGFAKNGAMLGEALVLFDPALAQEARHRRKRAGHLPARGRLIAAQIAALLEDDLWMANARAANAAAVVLGAAAGDRLIWPVEANMVFVRLTRAEVDHLSAQGFVFYQRGEDDAGEPLYRFVTGWHHTPDSVAPLAAALRGLQQ